MMGVRVVFRRHAVFRKSLSPEVFPFVGNALFPWGRDGHGGDTAFSACRKPSLRKNRAI